MDSSANIYFIKQSLLVSLSRIWIIFVICVFLFEELKMEANENKLCDSNLQQT